MLEHEPASKSHVASLDGLRALACLAVFGVHFEQITGVGGNLGPLSVRTLLVNGNTGVCLFFVLSGFLLSLPFWRSAAGAGRHGRTSVGGARWMATYALRRIGRIVPAYYLCLAVLVIWQRQWASGRGLVDVLLHCTFLHNLTERSFYGISPPFWTLAVQAQFYVLFPVLTWILWPAMRRRGTAAAVLVACTVGAYAAHCGLVAWVRAHPASLPLPPEVLQPDGFVLERTLLAHLPHFLIGMFAAGVFTWSGSADRAAASRGWAWELLFWGALAATMGILGVPELDQRFQVVHGRYHFPYVPLLVALMIVSAARARVAGAVLSFWPVRTLGVISYGMYVYHLPCMKAVAKAMSLAGMDAGSRWMPFGLASLAASIAVAACSYVLLERPILRAVRRRGA